MWLKHLTGFPNAWPYPTEEATCNDFIMDARASWDWRASWLPGCYIGALCGAVRARYSRLC